MFERTTTLAMVSAALMLTIHGGCSDEATSAGDKVDVAATDSGGDVDVVTAKSVRTLQQALDETAWLKELADDAALGGLATPLTQPLQAAGVIEDDDGGRLIWGEYAASPLAPRQEVKVIYRFCAGANAGSGCGVGRGEYTATGIALRDTAGAAVSHVGIGRAVLLKEAVKGQSEGYPTVLRGALEQSGLLDPAATAARFGQMTWGKRRFVVINAYGSEVGVAANKTRAAAQASGRYDEVMELSYARRTDVDRLLAILTPLDTLVWLAAGVVETYKSGKPAKSVGMTVSQGIFGDAYYHRDFVGPVLDHPPLGGPGLVVLAGSNTLFADSPGQSGIFASYLRAFPYRPVVGFDGKMEADAADSAAAALIAALAKGDDLEQAMVAASAAGGAMATSLLEPETRKVWWLPLGNDKLLGKKPSSGKLKLHMSINPPVCVDVGGLGATCDAASFDAAAKAGKTVDPATLTAQHATFSCDAVFTGPYFTCSADNPTFGAKFEVRGVLQGGEVGATVAVYAHGSASDKVQGITLIGEGTIKVADVGGGSTTLLFDGPVVASTFSDASARCCITKKPALSSNTSEPSSLTF